MTLIYPWLGLALAAGLALVCAVVWRRSKAAGPGGGTRLANTRRLAYLPSFLGAVRRHHSAAAAALAFALVAALGTVVLAARPARADFIDPAAPSRDVVLCLDVSGSMYPVDAAILEQFRQIVRQFDGERVAMSWFNSSSVTLFPLTDDYEFIDQTLAPLERQFEAVANAMNEEDLGNLSLEDLPDDTGTLMGEGSSLPGDGLVSCLQLFDHKDVERPRSVILATDNMVEGASIFDLLEAAAMASETDVRVYALCPEGVFSSGLGLFGGNYGSEAAYQELREAAESTGGAYYDAGGSGSVRRIVEDILAQEAKLLDDQAPIRVIYDRPLLGVILLLAGLGGVAWWGGWRRARWASAARRGSLLVLAGLIAWNPALGSEKYRQTALEADVIVLVDTSPSIAAEDWDGDRPRLEGVQADVAAIAAHHSGAHLSIIAFDASAQLVLPLTTDAGAVAAAADTLAPVSTIYASGSSIDSGLDLLRQALERAQGNHPERARLVYYLGDGEQTSGQPIKSFEDLAPLVDGGAVLGYGTEAGGPMKEYTLVNWGLEGMVEDPAPDYIAGPDGERGISKIDQGNLEAIADQMGLGYRLRSADAPVAAALWSGDLPERTLEKDQAARRPLGPWLAVVAAALLAWEIWVLGPRLRRAREALNLALTAGRTGAGS